MIERLLPGAVAAAEAFGDTLDAPLFPEEQAVVAQAVPKRRQEFRVVRACARTALAQLGLPPVPLLPGRRGETRWPDGVVGSMTHCDGYRASAVAWRKEIAAIGIDAEPDAPLPDGVLGAISLPAERGHISTLQGLAPAVSWDRLLFSAKEAVFKAWYPITRSELDFSEAQISFDAEAGTFRARLLVPGLPIRGTTLTRLDGRWLADQGLVVCAIAIPAAAD